MILEIMQSTMPWPEVPSSALISLDSILFNGLHHRRFFCVLTNADTEYTRHDTVVRLKCPSRGGSDSCWNILMLGNI